MIRKDNMIIKRTVAFFLTTCCIITLFLPNLFIAKHGDHLNHKCECGHCVVCIRIHDANTILNGMHNALGSCASVAIQAGFVILFIIILKKDMISHDTLISLKIRLDD